MDEKHSESPAGETKRGAGLRFAVMCSGESLPRWAADTVERLLDHVNAELVLAIIDPTTPQPSPLSARIRKSVTFRANLWHLHNKLFPLAELSQHQRVPLATLWPALPRRVCPTTLHGKWTQRFEQDDLTYLQGLNLDFILKFGYGIIRGDILTAARYGVWSFHHDDEQQFRGGPPAFWEIVTGTPVQGAILQRLTERLDGGVLLDKVWVNTEPLSYRRNLARILDASRDMPARVASRLASGQADRLLASPVTTSAPIYVAPTDRQMVGLGLRWVRNYIGQKRANQAFERWNIGVVRAPIHRFLEADFVPEVEWAPYHRDGLMLADPFAIPDGTGLTVYCEEFSFFTERGWISDVSWSPTTGWGEVRSVLDDGAHMSYPYPVQVGGETRILPECGSRDGLTLYRCAPDGLVAAGHMLLGHRLLDATVCEHDGRWWLFATPADDEPNAKLWIFFGPHPDGPWTPHPENPVKTDVRNGRPAGTPFVHEGRLFRPAQDCSVRYGWRLVLNEVLALTPDHFDERPVRTVGPLDASPYPHGFHTLSACGNYTLVDAKWEGLNPRLMRHRLAKKFLRLLHKDPT